MWICANLSKNPFKATNIEKLVTYFLKSGVKPYQVELMFGWCSVDVRFQNAQLLPQVGIITPYEGQRVIVSDHIVVFWLYFLWYLFISGIHQFHLVKAYICSVLQRQTCFSHKAYTSNCQFAKVAPKISRETKGICFFSHWSQGHQKQRILPEAYEEIEVASVDSFQGREKDCTTNIPSIPWNFSLVCLPV